MIRCLLGLLLALPLVGGESPVAIGQAARDAAERQLAEVRIRIQGEHAALLARLQQAVGTVNRARDRLTAAESAAATAKTEAAIRAKEQERELTLVRQLADRATVAARLSESEARSIAGQTPWVRIQAAIAGLERRIAVLPERLARRLTAEPVVGRDGAIATVPVLRLGEARAIALGGDDAHRGILARSADVGSWLVVGPRLPVAVRPQGHAATIIPLDVAGSAAHQADAVHRSLAEWVAAGRAFIWPIIAACAVGLGIVVVQLVVLLRSRVDPGRLVMVADLIARRELMAARASVAQRTTPLDRVLGAGLDAADQPRETREAAVEQVLLAESARLTRGLTAVAVLAGVAPLLGLLGTVTGMIDMFSVIAAQGSGNAKSLSGGVSEALICTQAGMLAAIPLLLAHAWLGRMAERRSQVLEEAACGILGLSEHGDRPTLRAPEPALAP
jgi:biopolymer transport protein ExbB